MRSAVELADYLVLPLPVDYRSVALRAGTGSVKLDDIGVGLALAYCLGSEEDAWIKLGAVFWNNKEASGQMMQKSENEN